MSNKEQELKKVFVVMELKNNHYLRFNKKEGTIWWVHNEPAQAARVDTEEEAESVILNNIKNANIMDRMDAVIVRKIFVLG